MAPPEFSNVDFFNLQSSITNLDRALDYANSQKTVRKGARRSSAHKPLEELRGLVEDDLSKVLNSPLRPASRESGYGCLPLEAVQPVRRLHEMLFRIVGPGGDAAILNDADTAADFHARLQALVAPIDPNHPFLKVDFEFEGEGHDRGDDEQQQQTSSAKGKGKQVAGDDGQQRTSSAKGKGKQAVSTLQGKIIDHIEEFRIFLANQINSACSAPAPTPVDDGRRRSARILARRTQVLADEQDVEDLAGVQLNEGGDEGDVGDDKCWEDLHVSESGGESEFPDWGF